MRLLAASVLVGAVTAFSASGAVGQSFLTASENQTAATPPKSSSWFNPFSWTNESAPSTPVAARQAAPATQTAPAQQQSQQQVSAPRRGLAGLNPFKWTNDTAVAQQAPPTAPREGTRTEVARTFGPPPERVLPAVATDGPVQPPMVQHASADAYPNALRPRPPRATELAAPLRQPVEWPAASSVAQASAPPAPASYAPPAVQTAYPTTATPTVAQTAYTSTATPTAYPPSAPPTRHSSAGQGVNPFNWSNAAPANYQDFGSGRAPFESQPLGRALATAQQPLEWSNDPRGQVQPRDFTPPVERSFGSTVEESLRYVQPGGPQHDQMAHTRPPANGTKADMIAWEKENLPYTRPFYMSNAPENEIPYENEQTSRREADFSVLARPFMMTNDPPAAPQRRQAPQSQPIPAPDVSRDTRRVAYLQNGEPLPQPAPVPLTDPNSLGDEEKGTLAQAEKIGEEPPESNTLQFLRADTVLLDPGEWQFDYGFTYTKFDTEFPVLLDAGGGLVEIAEAQFRIREFQVPFELRHGVSRRVQAFLNVPFGWANTELTIFDELERFENDGGLGDITFGATFLLRENCPCKPDAILTVATTAPTGDDPFAPTAIGSPAAPTLGNGTWSLSSNLLFIQNYDPVVVFYGFGTRQHFVTEIDGVNFQAGGEYNYLMGVGFAVNSDITLSTRFNGAYITEARLDGQRIEGTISEPMVLTVAMTMVKCDKLIEPFVDFGLTDDAVDARIGITWTR